MHLASSSHVWQEANLIFSERDPGGTVATTLYEWRVALGELLARLEPRSVLAARLADAMEQLCANVGDFQHTYL